MVCTNSYCWQYISISREVLIDSMSRDCFGPKSRDSVVRIIYCIHRETGREVDQV